MKENFHFFFSSVRKVLFIELYTNVFVYRKLLILTLDTYRWSPLCFSLSFFVLFLAVKYFVFRFVVANINVRN